MATVEAQCRSHAADAEEHLLQEPVLADPPPYSRFGHARARSGPFSSHVGVEQQQRASRPTWAIPDAKAAHEPVPPGIPTG
jgi:hypothetical protein